MNSKDKKNTNFGCSN